MFTAPEIVGGGPPSYICRLSGVGHENWTFWLEVNADLFYCHASIHLLLSSSRSILCTLLFSTCDQYGPRSENMFGQLMNGMPTASE